MRHRKKSEKFSRSRAQRKALVKSLLKSIVTSERIRTSESKAKALRPYVDKLIGWGKRGDLHSRRLSYKLLGDHRLVKRLFEELAPRFKTINGGYTRVIDLGYRKGDGALMSILELTRLEKKTKATKKRKETSAAAPEVKEKAPAKEQKPKEGFVSGMRKIFKKDKGA